MTDFILKLQLFKSIPEGLIKLALEQKEKETKKRRDYEQALAKLTTPQEVLGLPEGTQQLQLSESADQTRNATDEEQRSAIMSPDSGSRKEPS